MNQGKNRSTRTFLYRIEICGRDGTQTRHLAEARAQCDENARRKIIHKTLESGGRVVTISPIDDRTRYDGEGAKKTYMERDC